MKGIPTGFGDLDRVLVGLGESDLVLVGARPGMGKTSFALNIASSAAKNTKKAVAVFSLEVSCEQLVQRMISSEALIDSYVMRNGNLSGDDWKNLAHAASALSECDIWIDDTTGISVTGMKAKLRRLKNLGLVVIDYLQLMTATGRAITVRRRYQIFRVILNCLQRSFMYRLYAALSLTVQQNREQRRSLCCLTSAIPERSSRMPTL